MINKMEEENGKGERLEEQLKNNQNNIAKVLDSLTGSPISR